MLDMLRDIDWNKMRSDITDRIRSVIAQAHDVSPKDDKGVIQGGPNAPMMHVIASRLSEDDRRSLAAYIQGMR